MSTGSTLSNFLLGSQNPQQVSSSSSTASQLPAWLTQYNQNLLGSSAPLVGQTTSNLSNATSPLTTANPYLGSASSLVGTGTSSANQGLAAANPYLGGASSTLSSALSGPNGVSLATPSVNQASSIVGQAINPANSGTAAASPYISEANQTFNNPNTVSSYMSPYLNDVTAYNTQLSNENLEQQVLPAVASQSIANGDFAGSPMGNAEGWQINQAEQNLQAQNLAAANQGYTEAGTLFDTDAARQGTLAQLAGTLGTQQQGAELQGASTLGSLGTALGTLGNASQSNLLTGAGLQGSLGSTAGSLANTGASLDLTGANAEGSLGSAAGQLGATGNSELLSQLGLLTSESGVPGGTTTTTQASNPNPYSEMQTAGAGSSTLANALSALTGSNTSSPLGQIISALSGAGNNSYSTLGSYLNSQGITGETNDQIAGSITAPDASTITDGLPAINWGDTSVQYAKGGHVEPPQDQPKPWPPAMNWHTLPPGKKRFMAADGEAVRGYAGGGVTLPSLNQDLSLGQVGDVYIPTTGSLNQNYTAPITSPSLVQSGPNLLTGTSGPSGPSVSSTLGNALGSLFSGSNSQLSGLSGPSGSVPIVPSAPSLNADLGDAGLAVKGANLVNSATGDASGLGSDLGAAGSVIGGLGTAVNFAENPANPSNDINAGLLVGNTASSALGDGTAGSALGGALGIGTGAATAGIGLGALAVEAIINSLTRPNNPDKINVGGAEAEGLQVNPDGKLPSGNSILTAGDLGVGAGTQSSKGSGEIYQVDPSGSAADNSLYHWIGQSDSTNLENDAHNLSDWLKSGAVTDSGGNYTATDAAGQRTLGGISDIFNQTGGAAAWGMTEPEFTSALNTMLSSGVYQSGDAFGKGN